MGKRRVSIQEAVPVEVIFRNGVVKSKLGTLAVILEVAPVGLGMLDREERKEFIRKYHDFLKRLPGPAALLARDASPDLSRYLEALRERAREAPTAQHHALALELLGHVQALLAAQTVREKRFYLILTAPAASAASLMELFRSHRDGRGRISGQAEALLQQAQDLASHLGNIGLPARVLSPVEVVNLLRASYDPARPPVSPDVLSRPVVSVEEEEGDEND